jgi:hypothetical protein
MLGQVATICARDLYAWLGTAAAPSVLDARRGDAFDADDRHSLQHQTHNPSATAAAA